ncbi:hypothetical protein F5883DRAFT_578658 [Diaporthe sp. PMI_573]|nr:hypothetical protein F5883DRAFT_578658 [Diaporthaceae sp. PMI_573]
MNNRPPLEVVYENEGDVEVECAFQNPQLRPSLTRSSIIAVHGLGANVDWSWTWKDATDPGRHVKWLQDPDMLPAVVPKSRIMLYNYDSKWHANAPRTRLQLCGEDLVRSMITSRPYQEIDEVLREFPHKDLASFEESKGDIDKFINEKVADLQRKKRYTPKVTSDVTQMLRDKSEGIFLWIGLACAELNQVVSKDAVKRLQDIPKGLVSLYSKLLNTK